MPIRDKRVDAKKTEELPMLAKLKEQDRKEIIRKHLKAMTVDDIASFVDQLFSTIQILCGMVDQSRAAMVRSSIEPIGSGFGSDVTIIDLTMLQDQDDTPAADDLVHQAAPAKTSRFHLQVLPLPLGATVEGETVKIPSNYSNILVTAPDGARYRKEERL